MDLTGKGRETRLLACGCTDVWLDGKYLGRGPVQHTGEHSEPFPPVTSPTAAAEAPRIGSRIFATGATRDVDTGKLDYEGFLSPIVLRRYAEYMHKCRTRNVPPGEAIRASDNWQKGITPDAYAKSEIRHTAEFWLLHDGFEARDEKGQVLDIEDVLCAKLFNTMGYLFERLKKTVTPAPSDEK
jgi:hypothetical protein